MNNENDFKDIDEFINNQCFDMEEDLNNFLVIEDSHLLKKDQMHFLYNWLSEKIRLYGFTIKTFHSCESTPFICVNHMINGETRPSSVFYTSYDVDSGFSLENKIYIWACMCSIFTISKTTKINCFWIIDSEGSKNKKYIDDVFRFGTLSPPLVVKSCLLLHTNNNVFPPFYVSTEDYSSRFFDINVDFQNIQINVIQSVIDSFTNEKTISNTKENKSEFPLFVRENIEHFTKIRCKISKNTPWESTKTLSKIICKSIIDITAKY